MTLSEYRQEMREELGSILDYWMRNTIDEKEGGFFGTLDEKDKVHPEAPKGAVLNSRILWAFSAAYAQTHEPRYLTVARRAYEYLMTKFIDPEFGGVYWSVDHTGAMLNGRKQIYALAFSMYGLSEYYLATMEKAALEQAISLFRTIELHGFDAKRKGYYEAFTRNWQSLDDLRLSPKDANESKTMNTHLHVVEAYANLYRAWPDAGLKQQISGLLEVFGKYFIDPSTGHLRLFFDDEWTIRSGIVSYGHDIEAAWLLQASAGVTGEDRWIKTTKDWALKIALASLEGLDSDGGLWYEKEEDHLVMEKHSWPQAEAMIGFLNAWQLTGGQEWLERSMASWAFVRNYIKDLRGGEWFWGVRADHSPMPGQDKAGFWKCPYHNSRACLEVIRRIEKKSI